MKWKICREKKFELNFIKSFIIFDLSDTFFEFKLNLVNLYHLSKSILKKVLLKSKITTKQTLQKYFSKYLSFCVRND